MTDHKLFIANRGEIAVRIIRTAKRLGIPTVAIYSQTDATSPHALLADEAIPLRPEDTDPVSNSRGYLDIEAIIEICERKNVTLVHPGYGFLSENALFARKLEERGIILLGPSAGVIEDMGLKHKARELAISADVPVVPGSEGLIHDLTDAIQFASSVGFPVILKATAGGGGMGLVVCMNEDELRARFTSISARAEKLFHNDGVFLEKFYESSRHIEVQIFGDGNGHVIHMCERECSVQRRHQKIIEEAPSPFVISRPQLRDRMCSAAVRIGKLVNYKSAGTVEFLVDDTTGNFYFLEMNTRLQVEHGVTETIFPGLDIIELMIKQGLAEYDARHSSTTSKGINLSLLRQEHYSTPTSNIHAIETRVYCENPVNKFSPSPGVLQYVHFPEGNSDLRVDTWVSTGTVVTPYFDPLIAKFIIRGDTREDAISRLNAYISESPHATRSTVRIDGPPTNLTFLRQILAEDVFLKGNATNEWVDSGRVLYSPYAFSVVSPGLNATVQALPERRVGLGVPRSGPMDVVGFKVANILAGNYNRAEGVTGEELDALEVVVPTITVESGKKRGGPLALELLFHNEAVVGLAGALAVVTLDGELVDVWSAIHVHKGGKLRIGGVEEDPSGTYGGGLRVYVAVRGGFTSIPSYLGSKSTSIGIGGYQGRPLHPGDLIFIGTSTAPSEEPLPSIPRIIVPSYPSSWVIYVLSGPHDDPGFITPEGIEAFYSRRWRVSTASNRMGIRLEQVKGASDNGVTVIEWARPNGGEGGSHPSNILDSGYAPGSINLNGDTPVILTKEGPSMGGYLCASTVCTGDMWKLGQAKPGDTITFVRLAWDGAMELSTHTDNWVESLFALSSGFNAKIYSLLDFRSSSSLQTTDGYNPKLFEAPTTGHKPRTVFRQAGDSAILVEYGEMHLDIALRARIHALETRIREHEVPVDELAPCIRSTMVHFDPSKISQSKLLSELIEISGSLPESILDMSFPGRKITFPIALDDKWNREAIERYMRSSRDKAVYLPSNVEYLARNNGLRDSKAALELLVRGSWLVFGVGFYLACPFLVPVDPRARLVGQKMNPSRTYTPRGAIGIAGVVAAIYPIESPGGYQLYGRTLPAWQTWGIGCDFSPEKPWLLEPFDHVAFEVISEAEYIEFEKKFDAGRYQFKIEPTVFSMKEYFEFEESVKSEVDEFGAAQSEAVAREEARENELLKEWQNSLKSSTVILQDDDEITYTKAGASTITSPIAGTVWKINARLGDKIHSIEEALVILEAMKTEVNVTADPDDIGKTVIGFGKSVKEGSAVRTGEVLVVLN